ncbi:FAD-binding oxidoreductase [Cryobacterium sp. AP23]
MNAQSNRDTHGSTHRSVLSQLRSRITGDLIDRSDPRYDDARRVWNGMIDRRPIAVVRAGSPADIAPTLDLAAEQGLPLAVRGGGHNVAGNGTVADGLVLDLSDLNGVQVDAGARTVRVQAGATLAHIDRATEPFNLAVPIGVVSNTGIAGLTLGGGVGWLTRAYGLTVDNLLSAEVVTVAGDTVTASETENPDLFWGLRGGGGNFGVVTEFTFRAHPIPALPFTGTFVYPAPLWESALSAYEAWTRDLPDELTSVLTFTVPPPVMGMGTAPLMLVGFAWATDDSARAEQVVDRLRRAAPPAMEATEPVSWPAWQSSVDAVFPKGSRGYWRNSSFDQLDPDVIAALMRRGTEQTWVGTGFDIHHLGGAFGRVPEEATPFPSRAARYWLNIYGFWAAAEDDQARTAFIRSFGAEVEPLGSGGRYVNFLGEEQNADPVQQAEQVYGVSKLERLAVLKRDYDPQNLLRRNHNILPAVATGDTD